MARIRILLVEDNEMNRDMLSRRLERRGFEVIPQGRRPAGGPGCADRVRPGSGEADGGEGQRGEGAQAQFEAIGMTGWIRRADELQGRLG